MSDEDDDVELSGEAFYTHVIPSVWIGLLDLVHDVMMRLGEFLEVQGKMFEEAKTYMQPKPEGAEIIPFPTANEGEQSE